MKELFEIFVVLKIEEAVRLVEDVLNIILRWRRGAEALCPVVGFLLFVFDVYTTRATNDVVLDSMAFGFYEDWIILKSVFVVKSVKVIPEEVDTFLRAKSILTGF